MEKNITRQSKRICENLEKFHHSRKNEGKYLLEFVKMIVEIKSERTGIEKRKLKVF